MGSTLWPLDINGRKKNRSKRGREKGQSSSGGEEEARMWKQIWSLNIKKKLKHFIWKACHDRLPVGSNVQKRGVKVDGICMQCGEASESGEHLFFHCRKSKLIWKLAPVSWEGSMSFDGSVKEWWIQHSNSKKCGEFQSRIELTVYLWWQIWKARNEWMFRGEMKSEYDIVRSATNDWLEYNEAREIKKKKGSDTITVKPPMPWEPPERDVIKLNVSSVCDDDCMRVGLGGIARDTSRKMLYAWAVARDSAINTVVA
ncbi:MAG: hypothetical protein PCALPYG88_7425, partial [uncultured Paraburkholderia sp.]|uniref:zinc-binding domain-containing protein n=1 Tax=uncultured Paraburkholderia sp. TaxID=1822466 RepID=UPI002593A9D5